MKWNEYKSIKYYHAEISKNSTLIVSSPSGLLTIFKMLNNKLNVQKIKSDMNCKKIRFYPDDDHLFTSSDPDDGLRVWDTEKQEIIFSYPKDIIQDHIYVQERHIAAQTEIGIKFFDLRMRYSSRFFRKKYIKKIDFYNNDLFYATNYDTFKLKGKNEEHIFSSKKEIKDFSKNVCLTTDSLFFIRYNVEKKHTASRIIPYDHPDIRHEKVLISTIYENTINIIESNNEYSKNIEICKKITYAIRKNGMYCVFGDDKLFIYE